MVVWFLKNFESENPRIGMAYFGDELGMQETLVLDNAPETGFMRPSFTYLTDEFRDTIASSTITTTSNFLPGSWLAKPWDPAPQADQNAQGWEAALPRMLENLAGSIERLQAKQIGRGHNRPPGGVLGTELSDAFRPITETEKTQALAATSDARLAAISRDHSALHDAWQAISPIVEKISSALFEQIKLALPVLTLSGAGYIVIQLGTELQIVSHSEAVHLAMTAIAAAGMRGKQKKD